LIYAALSGALLLGGLRQAWRLINDRLILAGGLWLKWGEGEHQFEVARDANNSRTIQIVRYTGTCPICSSTLELAHGKQQFPGRIVARCRESPIEHVYSFDRITREGVALVTELGEPSQTSSSLSMLKSPE